MMVISFIQKSLIGTTTFLSGSGTAKNTITPPLSTHLHACSTAESAEVHKNTMSAFLPFSVTNCSVTLLAASMMTSAPIRKANSNFTLLMSEANIFRKQICPVFYKNLRNQDVLGKTAWEPYLNLRALRIVPVFAIKTSHARHFRGNKHSVAQFVSIYGIADCDNLRAYFMT